MYKSIKIVYQEINSLWDILYFILAHVNVKYLITHKQLIFLQYLIRTLILLWTEYWYELNGKKTHSCFKNNM